MCICIHINLCISCYTDMNTEALMLVDLSRTATPERNSYTVELLALQLEEDGSKYVLFTGFVSGFTNINSSILAPFWKISA